MTGAPTSGHWHVDDESMRRWVAGLAGPLISISVEQHLLQCAPCRAEVASLVPPTPLDSVWEDVLTAVEVPRPGFVERLLRRSRLSASDAMVVASAAAMRVAWLGGSIAILAFVTCAALLGQDGGVTLFLVAAPLIPVAGVAAAYGPSSDPSYETALVAPYAMIRLILLRTIAVLVTSVPLVVVTGLLLPASTLVAVAWLLPAAVFIAAVLTASNWVDPVHAALVISVGWVGAVALADRTGDPLAVFDSAAVITYVVLLAITGMTLLHRLYGKAPSWRLR
jgi:hypothetical protein